MAWVVTWPKFAVAVVLAVVLGGPNCTRLNRLNASARRVRLTLPAQARLLRDGEVPVVDAVGAQIGIDALRIAQGPAQPRVARRVGGDERGVRHGIAGGVEPPVEPFFFRPRDALVAAVDDVRAQAVAEADEVRRGGEGQGQAGLEEWSRR